MPVLYCKLRNQRSEEIITQRTTSGILTGKIYMIINRSYLRRRPGRLLNRQERFTKQLQKTITMKTNKKRKSIGAGQCFFYGEKHEKNR